MTTEDKALVLLNEVSLYKCENVDTAPHKDLCTALRRAIEQHEAFRQKVSDAVELSIDRSGHDGLRAGHINEYLGRFIIPAPKPDPLVEVISEIEDGTWGETKAEYADRIRAALDARGLEIREKSK